MIKKKKKKEEEEKWKSMLTPSRSGSTANVRALPLLSNKTSVQPRRPSAVTTSSEIKRNNQ